MNNLVDRILSIYQLMRPLDPDRVSDSRQRITRYIESLASAGQSDAQQLNQGTESGLTLEMSEDRGEIVDIPAGALSPEFDAALVVDCPGEIYRKVSDDSHVSCTMPLSQA